MRGLILATLFVVAGVYVWNTGEFLKATPACSQPIVYSIGFFDRKFGVSYDNFLHALKEAEDIWESTSGQNLFEYNPQESVLDINLIYDYRQEVTNTLFTINDKVETNESTYNALRRQFNILKAQYESDEKFYDNLVALFNTKNEAYERQLEAWNNGSRTSKKEFDAIEQERLALQEYLSDLKRLETKLNEKTKEVNLMVEKINIIARTLNLDVEQFNAVGASRGETFTGGLYTQDNKDRRIDVFEFQNHDKLVRVIAHELGHALGLDHISDPEAVMYYLNKGETKTLTESDLEELKKVCNLL